VRAMVVATVRGKAGRSKEQMRRNNTKQSTRPRAAVQGVIVLFSLLEGGAEREYVSALYGCGCGCGFVCKRREQEPLAVEFQDISQKM
jgi:hypothetical protein